MLDIRPKLGSLPPMFTKYYIKSRLGALVSEITQDNCCGSRRLGTAAETFTKKVSTEVRDISGVSKKSLASLSFYKSLKGSESFTHIIKNSKKSTSLVTLWKQGMFLKNEFAAEGESAK